MAHAEPIDREHVDSLADVFSAVESSTVWAEDRHA